MSLLICSGAGLQCSCGLSVSTMNVTPEKGVLASSPIACLNDNVAFKNIMPFGMCNSLANPQVAAATSAALGVLTPQPCTPMIAGPWAPASTSVFLGSTPAITTGSQLLCSYGGIIKLISPGQTNLMAN